MLPVCWQTVRDQAPVTENQCRSNDTTNKSNMYVFESSMPQGRANQADLRPPAARSLAAEAVRRLPVGLRRARELLPPTASEAETAVLGRSILGRLKVFADRREPETTPVYFKSKALAITRPRGAPDRVRTCAGRNSGLFERDALEPKWSDVKAALGTAVGTRG